MSDAILAVIAGGGLTITTAIVWIGLAQRRLRRRLNAQALALRILRERLAPPHD
jgi:hypothetical protein